jgi:hypothetical protein
MGRKGAKQSAPDSASHGTLVRTALRAIGCQPHSVMIVIMIMLPIVLSLPSMIFPIPPLMMLIPTTLPFGIQISPPVLGFAAVLALVVDGFVQSCLRLFDRMLALPSVIGMRRWCCYKQQKRRSHYRCHCCVSKSSIQDPLLSVSMIASRNSAIL